jgi:hypothetical protein
MNRFTEITPSQFNPLSLQEIMMVPAMKRKEHDEILAKQELLRAGLAKVDPLDVHYDRALQLKHDLESQLDSTAEQLAREGFNSNMTSKAIALNRRYNDLTSPTGELGKINTAKQVYDKKKADFLKLATEQYGAQQAINLWNQKTKSYTGYDPNQKIANIGDYGIVAKQDYQDDLKLFNGLLGSTMSEVSRGGGNITYDEKFGGFKTTNSNISQAAKNNLQQLNEMAKTLGLKWLNPTGEGYKFNQEAGINQSNFAKRFESDMLMQKQSSSSNKSDFNVSFNESNKSGKEGSDMIPTAEIDPTSTKEIGGDNGKVDFSRIGTIPQKTPLTPPKNLTSLTPEQQQRYYIEASKKGSKQTYTDIIKDPLVRKLYENTYKKLVKDKKIHPSRDMNDSVAASLIQNYINTKMPPVTLSNSVVRASIEPSSDMFLGAMVNKDANARNATMQQDLEYGFRSIIDPETGKELKPSEFKKKGWKVEYVGYDSPLNFRGYNFQNPKQQVMSHRVIVKDEEGNIIGNSVVGRTDKEQKSNEFKAASALTFSYRNAVLNSGEWTPFGTKESAPGNLRGMQIRYNLDGTVDVKDPSGRVTPEPISTDELSSFIFRNYKN